MSEVEEVTREVKEEEESQDDEVPGPSSYTCSSSRLSSTSSLAPSPLFPRRSYGLVPERSFILTELTSLDQLTFPSNTSKSIKYTCVDVSRRLLVLGTSTGSIYVFGRFASKHRSRMATLPLHVFTTKDGAVHKVSISPSEVLIGVGGETGRVSVLCIGEESSPSLVDHSGRSSTPSSPFSSLFYSSPPLDPRRPDRVNCMCWSLDSSSLYTGHSTGIVNVHKIGTRRSVFLRSGGVEKVIQMEGETVQLCISNEKQLLLSTVTASFVYDLSTRDMFQVGKKLRNGPMGACWMKSGEGMEFVLAARQNGRMWEASPRGIVYKTHQLRESRSFASLDIASFRSPSGLFPQSEKDTEECRQCIHFGSLHPISLDTNEMEDDYPPRCHNLALSFISSRVLIVDIDTSQIVLLTQFDHLIRDISVCGSDVFILFSGGIVLRKLTLFKVEKAVDKLLLKKTPLHAARLVLSVNPPSEWKMSLIDRITNALSSIKKKEAQSLHKQLKGMICGGDKKEEEKNRCSIPVHRVMSAVELEASPGDNQLTMISPLSERSRSSPDNSNVSSSVLDCRLERNGKSQSVREGGTKERFQQLRTARKLLDSDNMSAEHSESLRTLLDPASPPPIQFKHPVTVASVVRNLAELARVTPPEMSDLLVQRRSVRTWKGRGAKVVRPLRGHKKLGKNEEETNSNCIPGVVDDVSPLCEENENNVEWGEDEEKTVTISHLECGKTTMLTDVAPEVVEVKKEQCPQCSLHLSWLAIFLFGSAVSKVTVSPSVFSQDGAPSCVSDWIVLLSSRLSSSIPSPLPCSRCCNAVNNAMRTVCHGAFSDGLRPDGCIIDVERIRQKVQSLAHDVVRAALFGEEKKENGINEKEEEVKEENDNQMSTIVEGSSHMLTLHQLLLATLFCLGCNGLKEVISRLSPLCLDRLSDEDWSFISRILSPRIPPQTVSNRAASSLLNQMSLSHLISIDVPPPRSPSTRSIPSGLVSRRAVTVCTEIGWSVDRGGCCPLCSLSLKCIVGGKDGGVVVFPCGHSFHAMCMGERKGCVVCRVRMRRSRGNTVGGTRV